MLLEYLTIFPEYFQPLQLSLIGKAQQSGILTTRVHDLRNWSADRNRRVDDTPYGGGPGMVMRPEPWGAALDEIAGGKNPTLILLTPAGAPFTQQLAAEFAADDHLIFACGRYEGIDERVAIDAARRWPVRPVSLGDYVLNGGEVAALAITEALVRLLPGVVGNAESLVVESHSDELNRQIEGPTYTRPPSWRGLEVPEVLLGGNHALIERWRREQAAELTRTRRPDLLGDRTRGAATESGQTAV